MFHHHRSRRGKIIAIVGSKIQSQPLPGFGRDLREEIRLHQPIFMMPALGPRIRKQHKNIRKSDVFRQRRQEILRARVQKVKITQPRPVFLPIRPLYAFGDDIQTDTRPLGVRCRISRQKMPMPCADFQHTRPHPRQ